MNKKQIAFERYHQNPRKITPKQLEELEESHRVYGDLSGVVYNRRTQQLVGGNQRSKVFDLANCEIRITEASTNPDDQGTVAIGYIEWEGHN